MKDSIAQFVENYVSVRDLVTGLLIAAISGICALIFRAIGKRFKALRQNKEKTRTILQYVMLFVAFSYSGGMGVFIGINHDNPSRVICGTLFIVYFSIRLSILMKSILDESVDASQNRLPTEINSDGDSSSDK